MLRYKAVEIFTSGAVRCRKKPLMDAVIQYVREPKIAARCIVLPYGRASGGHLHWNAMPTMPTAISWL